RFQKNGLVLNHYLVRSNKLISNQYLTDRSPDCHICSTDWFIIRLKENFIKKSFLLEEFGLCTGNILYNDLIIQDDIFKVDNNSILLIQNGNEIFRCYILTFRKEFTVEMV
ncbi:hypothetical protein M153_47580001427, partial [Pseudoloma neurophilia]